MVHLDWDLWCPGHLSPLRSGWPKVAALAMMGLFNAAVRDERVIELAGGDAEELQRVLRSVRPVCCLVGDETMHMVIGYAKQGQVYSGKGGPMEPPR